MATPMAKRIGGAGGGAGGGSATGSLILKTRLRDYYVIAE
jgi:hypothetical protein